MRRILLATLTAALVLPAAAHAQANASAMALKQTYTFGKNFILRTAEKVPEDVYNFRPTPDVRSFGEILGHIMDAQAMLCAAGMSKEVQPPGHEKMAHGKADMIAGLKASFAECDAVYDAATDATLGEAAKVFGNASTRAFALSLNAAHNFEHYGNLVTYMRIKGIVPPSSEGN